MFGKKAKRVTAALLFAAIMTLTGAGCSSNNVIDIAEYGGDDLERVALAAAPAVSTILMPVASGKTVLSNAKAEIDASNTGDGYVMVKYSDATTSKLKVIVEGPSGAKYTYNLNGNKQFEVFPLSDGNGTYTVGVYKNIQDTKYSTDYKTTVSVKLKDEYAPFLLPNQYVNYTAGSQTVAKAAELTKNQKGDLDKIKAVYEYVVTNFTYDKQKAATVQSGYLPKLDDVLAKKTGICFDYAALMAGMLRSQGIPCKLVVGDAGTAYHAWINAYSKTEGWMDGVIYFDGKQWKLMDPTFASSGNQSDSIMKFIGDGKNYTAKYLY
ncbi:MAG: transglutaminase-like domain-containing protein [Oscillospiraceae bacterium]|nr:transglutaminase-like domain-containing protein [Oscillospiraceae bacterium]